MKVIDINSREIFDVTIKGDEVALAGDSRTLTVTKTIYNREFGRGGCLVEVTEDEYTKPVKAEKETQVT